MAATAEASPRDCAIWAMEASSMAYSRVSEAPIVSVTASESVSSAGT